MRDPARIDEFCNILKRQWHEVPDWRFCQLINNILAEHDVLSFYMEDDEALDKIKHYFDQFENKED